MELVGAALALAQQGRRPDARGAFESIWDAVGPDGDALHVLALAHHLADLSDDPYEELAWDRRALAAADRLDDARLAASGAAGGVAGLYPSLHLNLGEASRKVGDHDAAVEHLARGRAALDALADDGYARMIRGGLDGLAERLGEGLRSGGPPNVG